MYTLPESIAEYSNQNIEDYASGRELKSSILVKNPIVDNIDSIKKLYDVLKSVSRDKHQANEINLDNILEKI